MSAQQDCHWLLGLAQLDPGLNKLLAPWKAQYPEIFLTPTDDCPAADVLEIGVWLAGLVEYPAGMMNRLHESGAKPEQLSQWKAESSQALSRDPEPPIDWVNRALRHLTFWIENGQTPFAGYYSLRRLHFLTRSRSSRLIALITRAIIPASATTLPESLLGLSEPELPAIFEAVAQESVTILPRRLPAKLIEEIRYFAEITPCMPSLANVEHRDPVTGENILPRMLFDPVNPMAHRYDFDFGEIWQCQAIQQIAADPIWPWLAEQYLGAEAKLAMAYLWWSTAFDGPQSRYTGQVFHVDVDRFAFVNFFFYLKDVGSDNGPQIYVTGSHADMPLELAIDQRWDEQAIEDYYGKEPIKEIHGPAGSVIMADTLAYHRGKTLNAGTRLMFQMEFTSCTLGENNPMVPRPPELNSELAQALNAHPERFPRLKDWK